ncbi:restriction endonuclease subunit S [Burkholderia pseudomallei]|uniref:restriction endonuclease subunit S n=1 Tax=Burkholderia pseudomallei TaxID=28450 RepID=UPI0007BEBEF8|nr:restriction endonuclease subunit S [Burkholderia pseudomallei]OAB03392.1 restriction endonuclease subunit S [Burkholderia pseudomallei]
MSLPQYAKYKDSGVPWLGQVPTHWLVQRLKEVIAFIESGVSVNAIDTPAGEGEPGVLKTSCVYSGEFTPSENKLVVPEELGRVACPVKAGTVIVSRMNTPDLVGASGVVRQNYANLYLPDRLWQVHFKNACPEFVHYWSQTHSYRAQVESACAGTSSSMKNLSQDEFRSFILPLPPPSEQSAIATFLKHETRKINALIAEQEKLLTLLAEKRQATISRAVTRGLNPDAPTKDSGVAWLREVPAHWNLKPMKRAVVFQRGHDLPSEDRVEGNIPVVSSGGISGRHNAAATKGPTIVTGRYGTIGEFVLLEEDCWPLNTALYTVQMHDNVPKYLWYMLQSLKHIFILNSLKSAVPGVDRNDIHPAIVCLPPAEEQPAIVAFLDAEISKLDALRADAERAIDLLKERRSALIAAAVTGKIDVRNVMSRELAA